VYEKIIKSLQKYGEVLTEHVGSSTLLDNGEEDLSDEEIYNRDMKWLKKSDVVVAEVSNPSLGVGYEISKAESENKEILCLYKNKQNKNLSAMISGSPTVTVYKYDKLIEVLRYIDNFFS
jgi:nucleoside 2-deoxyribosyltransferase